MSSAEEKVDALFALLEAQGQGDYIGPSRAAARVRSRSS